MMTKKHRTTRFLNTFLSVGLMIMFIFSFSILSAQVIDYPSKTSFSRDSILIGDQLHFISEIEVPDELNVVLPTFPDSIKGLEIIKTLGVDTTRTKKGTIIYRQKHLITSFDSGVYQVHPLPFLLGSSNQNDTMWSEANLLNVQTLKADTTRAAFDIKAPNDAPYTIDEFIPHTIIALLLLVGVFVAFYFWKKHRNKNKLNTPVKPTDPAHVTALAKLEELEKNKLWQKGKVKKYHSLLTDTLRAYIEERFHIRAMEQTSKELLTSLKRLGNLSTIQTEQMHHIFTIGDLAKFAKTRPEAKDNENSLIYAKEFIEATIEKDLVEPESIGEIKLSPNNIKPQ